MVVARFIDSVFIAIGYARVADVLPLPFSPLDFVALPPLPPAVVPLLELPLVKNDFISFVFTRGCFDTGSFASSSSSLSLCSHHIKSSYQLVRANIKKLVKIRNWKQNNRSIN